MIIILSDDERRKAVVHASRGTCTVTYYRRAHPRATFPRWIYERCAESEYPLHLVLDMTVEVVNRP